MTSFSAKIQSLEKDIHSFLKKMDPMYRPETIRINISSSFMARARCVKCGKSPSYYYSIRNPFLYEDVGYVISNSKWRRSWIKSMKGNWYLDSEPKYFHDIQEFSFILDDKQYRPTLFRIMKGGAVKDRDNVVEMLGCDCGATIWAFNQKSVKNRPEITNRKGRYKYPGKFDY